MTDQDLQPNRFHAQLELVPEEPGVYIMRDAQGSVLYVGKANSLRHRLRNYFTKNPAVDRRIAMMIQKIASYDTILCRNELEALVLEANL
ncbi:MAG: GIY-YIG nuclease family protein, partial [Eubacteriales bacterium]|nr:GIY-YIG nuclease family protein [Eubacteriales bacterium]